MENSESKANALVSSCHELSGLTAASSKEWDLSGSGSDASSSEALINPDEASESARALPIPYTRAARARLDAAEAQGKAFDQQLELLAAVRAYFAEQGRPQPAAQQV